jgi:hypothetical protein
MAPPPHIGTLREKPLHAALKSWYALDGDAVESPVEGFVIDLVRDDVLIEIQTSGFSAMKRKLGLLLTSHAVRVVYPVAAEKWIVKRDQTGREGARRKSPKHGAGVDVFAELVAFPELISHPNFSLEVLLICEEEVRRFREGRAWRRKGWVIEERRLVAILERLTFDSPETLASLLPSELRTRFTTADLARALGRSRRLAQQMTYCLGNVGAIEIAGKLGNSTLYARA